MRWQFGSWCTLLTLAAPIFVVGCSLDLDPARIGGGSRKIVSERGYRQRACGFDVDHDGLVGEPGECHYCDGTTRDPDGDSVDEDIWYIDASLGSDLVGDGSSENPFRSIGKAMRKLDGPQNGEDIICVAGVFNEEVFFTQSGHTGVRTRGTFEYPDDPFMLVGWDKDNDGAYPPFDQDDVAVLDGAGIVSSAFNNTTSDADYLEIAHLTLRNYQDSHLFDFRTPGGSHTHHVYVHDLVLDGFNRGNQPASDDKDFLSLNGGDALNHVLFVNNHYVNVAGTLTYSPREPLALSSSHMLFRNNTIVLEGLPGSHYVAMRFSTISHVRVLNNVVNANENVWDPLTVDALSSAGCSEDWLVEGNEFYGVDRLLQVRNVLEGAPCKVDNVVLNRNLVLARSQRTLPVVQWGLGGAHSTLSFTTGSLTVKNNVFKALNPVTSAPGITSYAGNNEGVNPGTIRVVGNTMVNFGAAIFVSRPTGCCDFPHENYDVRNNVFVAHGDFAIRMGGGDPLPVGWLSNGNVFAGTSGVGYSRDIPYGALGSWSIALEQDEDSNTCTPEFVDPEHHNYRVAASDTCIGLTGVDISSVTSEDFDGTPRVGASNAGAFVVPVP